MSSPRISVVVATYNSERTLKKCIDSILEQTEKPQVLIVDGASSDATVEIVRSYADRIDLMISEPDRGVYDAWNKVIPHATGEWIVFIGSDDYFSTPDSLKFAQDCASLVEPNVAVIYGSVAIVDDHGRTLRMDNAKQGDINGALAKGMAFTHTGTLHRRVLFQQYGLFDPAFRIAGDYEFMLRVLRNERATYCKDYRITMGSGGVSNSLKGRYRLLQEMSQARKKNAVPWSLFVDGYVALKRLVYYLCK